MQEPFIINSTFLVNPEKNTITDKSTGNESRLEQRLLEVLYLLTATPGELVSREFIIASVWNDYGGADEGLTQSVSLLRKVLRDHNKQIIETIPKKGYVLNAIISGDDPVSARQERVVSLIKNRGKVGYIVAAVALAVIAVLIYMFTSAPAVNNHPQDVAPGKDQRPSGTRGADVQPDTTPSGGPDLVPDSLRH